MPAQDLADRAEECAYRGLEWLLAQTRASGDRRAWPFVPSAAETEPDLYSGSAGVVRCLVEAHAHDGDPRWAEAALAGARGLAATWSGVANSSLYFGVTGIGWILATVAEAYADEALRLASRQVVDVVVGRFDGERWGDAFDLMGGNAGIALAARALGELDLAVRALEPYLAAVEPTASGVTWENRRGMVPRRHHLSHGTLGIALALGLVGREAGRDDFVDLATRATADVIARNEAGPTGFLVPHSDPQQLPERIERFSFGWCHGPAGDAQVFRAFARAGMAGDWSSLVDRCARTVRESGIPERRRPGFWDNHGRCCGTAGVLALTGDRWHDPGDPADRAFADRLVMDVLERAVPTAPGCCWRNVEYRDDPPVLEPRTGWAMGVAGIVPELLRYARLARGATGAAADYAVPMPDQTPAS